MRRANITLAACLSLFALPLRADSDDPLARADLVSTIGLWRLADEAGDARLAAWIRSADRRDAALAGLRAAPFAAAPERLLPALASVLCGRDPNLAPEAAFSAHSIAERLQPAALAAREALVSDLRSARDALACAREARPALRTDLQSAALVLEAALSQLLP